MIQSVCHSIMIMNQLSGFGGLVRMTENSQHRYYNASRWLYSITNHPIYLSKQVCLPLTNYHTFPKADRNFATYDQRFHYRFQILNQLLATIGLNCAFHSAKLITQNLQINTLNFV